MEALKGDEEASTGNTDALKREAIKGHRVVLKGNRAKKRQRGV